jgi:hypothetical protein
LNAIVYTQKVIKPLLDKKQKAKVMDLYLDELLKQKEFTGFVFDCFIESVGLNNIRRKDLDLIIITFGINVFCHDRFSQIYNVVSSKETNTTMLMWTVSIGIMTLLYTIMTFIMLLDS